MEQYLVDLFTEYREFALWFSIAISIIVSIAGVLPSVFVTAANIAFFGFIDGLYISLAGEILGAIVSFYIYRKGIQAIHLSSRNSMILRLKSSKGLEAFFLVIGLRLFPFAPSGLVTLAGAGSAMGIMNYSIASTLGKIPALIIEAYAVNQVIHMNWQFQLALALISLVILSILFCKKKKNRHRSF